MLAAILPRKWWGSFMKGDENSADEVPLGDDSAELSHAARALTEGVNELDTSEVIEDLDPIVDEDVTPAAPAPKRGRGRSAEKKDGETDSVREDEFVPVDDDLTEIYDLEKGERLDREELTEEVLPWRSKVETPKEFFQTEILYRYDIMEPLKQKGLIGRYRFELRGYQGGVWTVNLGDKLDVVNRREDADVVFTMQRKIFLQVVNGEINPQLAFLAKKVKLSGDVKRALQFQEILCPVPE
jgi:hypothetical protein